MNITYTSFFTIGLDAARFGPTEPVDFLVTSSRPRRRTAALDEPAGCCCCAADTDSRRHWRCGWCDWFDYI